jgi:hypothetical protein
MRRQFGLSVASGTYGSILASKQSALVAMNSSAGTFTGWATGTAACRSPASSAPSPKQQRHHQKVAFSSTCVPVPICIHQE